MKATCPADAVEAANKECRAAVPGGCDVAEACDGVKATCPADLVEAANKECRAAADVCDVAEKCDGVKADCPANAFKTQQDACGLYYCLGNQAACPTSCGKDLDCVSPATCDLPDNKVCKAPQ
ncbi:MAG: hypothetical protein HY744_18025 [Deltaproteobacteria bacterium]|nr:hypothetical protein [Deltaproteobacteria bacterium]